VPLLLVSLPLVLEPKPSWVYDRLYISIYDPPSFPDEKSVILIKCDLAGSRPLVANSIAGIGVEFAEVPVDASMSTPAPSSTETFAIPQFGLKVACQNTAVPGKVRDTDDPIVVVYSFTPESWTTQLPSKCMRES